MGIYLSRLTGAFEFSKWCGAGRVDLANTIICCTFDAASLARQPFVAKCQDDSASRELAAITAVQQKATAENNRVRSALVLLYGFYWESHSSLLSLVSRLVDFTSQFSSSHYMADNSSWLLSTPRELCLASFHLHSSVVVVCCCFMQIV